MDLLLPFLVWWLAALGEGYAKSTDPNDEPFLPIYPVYPYSPKLIKRGTEKETATQLSPELYAPKVDAKDSYSGSFSSNHPRDPYYPNYNPYPKASSPSSYAYYSTLPYSYPTPPYTTYASYSSPYTVPPPSYTPAPYSSSYPGYYYQPPYYYPNYYSQPLFPPPPLPPPAADYPSESYAESEAIAKSKEKKHPGDSKPRDSELTRFVDGANYISAIPRDLDGQPNTYKSNGVDNQQVVEQPNDLQVKNLAIPLPKTTYRVISVAGQPVGPDYPLPAPYVKAQQLEEFMNHAWTKLIMQNLQPVTPYSVPEVTKNPVVRPSDGQYAEQNDRSKDTRLVSVPSVIAKAGLTYIVNPTLLSKLNVGQATGQPIQTPTTRLKSVKYPLNPGVYSAIEKPEKDQGEPTEYENYESSSPESSQDYDSSSQPDKQQESYENEPGQTYPNQNYVTVQTPRGYGNYQYSNYNPAQAIPQPQPQQYKNNLEDLNFGAKTKKG